MKKITLLFSLLGVVLFSFSQTKVTFEDQALNGASAITGGTVSVVANPVKTGINTSSYCLDVVSNSFASIKFTNFTFPTGSKTSYDYVTLKFKIAYKAYNSGTDLDYPLVNVFSSPSTPVLDATEKLGICSNVWGTHAADSLVWKTAQFTMSASVLATIPNGILALQLAKSKCEYLIDDIELIPSPIYNANVLTLNNFENNAVGDAIPYYKYWSTTSAASGTCVVAADPLTISTKALCITPTDYNGTAAFSVTLPVGKTLANYDRLYFDLYYNNSGGLNAQPYIYADGTMIFQLTSGYPLQGTSGVWNTKDYELSGMPSSNSFLLKIGYTSDNSIAYYLDNIKLHENVSTGFSQQQINPLVVSCDGTILRLNMDAAKIELFDLAGRSVLTQNNVKELNVSKLGNSVYIVKVKVGSDSYLTKFVK